MNYNSRNLTRIAKSITKLVEESIAQSGIFYRIFERCKSDESLENKLQIVSHTGAAKYDGKTKFIRDVIGIRINLYFVDDLEIITEHLKSRFGNDFVEETIDENLTTEFKPTRTNLIFRIPAEFTSEFRGVVTDHRIDATFELQIRTIFSEGWHEVEHDLRYKCNEDWDSHGGLARTFNGILAALETHEWSMIQVFERLSYLHYQNGKISPMVRTKFRIRLLEYEISQEIGEAIQRESGFVKELFKLERKEVVTVLLANRPVFPLTIDNLIWTINFLFLKSDFILKLTPDYIIDELKLMAKAKRSNVKDRVSNDDATVPDMH